MDFACFCIGVDSVYHVSNRMNMNPHDMFPRNENYELQMIENRLHETAILYQAISHQKPHPSEIKEPKPIPTDAKVNRFNFDISVEGKRTHSS